MTTNPGVQTSELPIQLAATDNSPAPAAGGKSSAGTDFGAVMSQLCSAKILSDAASTASQKIAAAETNATQKMIEGMLEGKPSDSRAGTASTMPGSKTKSTTSAVLSDSPNASLAAMMLAMMPQVTPGLPQNNAPSTASSVLEVPANSMEGGASSGLLSSSSKELSGVSRCDGGILSLAQSRTNFAAVATSLPAKELARTATQSLAGDSIPPEPTAAKKDAAPGSVSTEATLPGVLPAKNNDSGSLPSVDSVNSAISQVEKQPFASADAVKSPITAVTDNNSPPLDSISASLAAAQVAIEMPKQPSNKTQSAKVSPAGTVAALNKLRMNYTVEKNEIAGRTEKNVPGQAEISDSTANNGGKGASSRPGIAAITGRKKEVLDSSLVQDMPLKSSGANPPILSLKPDSKNIPSDTTSIERVARMVNQEVIMVRQSGAKTLAVSLKVDPQTELLLQVSNHNGQIQASISCSRGNAENLNAHWQQLQESLSRQNVQLMPLEGRTNTVTPTTASNPFDSSTTAGGSFNFRQSPQDNNGQAAESPVLSSIPAKTAGAANVAATKQKNNQSGRNGWESWA